MKRVGTPILRVQIKNIGNMEVLKKTKMKETTASKVWIVK